MTKQVTEQQFWKHVGDADQRGMKYDPLKISNKVGFYQDDQLIGYVERVLSHSSYFIIQKND